MSQTATKRDAAPEAPAPRLPQITADRITPEGEKHGHPFWIMCPVSFDLFFERASEILPDLSRKVPPYTRFFLLNDAGTEMTTGLFMTVRSNFVDVVEIGPRVKLRADLGRAPAQQGWDYAHSAKDGWHVTFNGIARYSDLPGEAAARNRMHLEQQNAGQPLRR